MPPKRSGKRKAPEPLAAEASGASFFDRATEPAVKSLYEAALESASDKDAALLNEVMLLGRCPKGLNFDALSTATEQRKAEATLAKRLEKRRKSLTPACIAFLDALKGDGPTKPQSRASEPVRSVPGAASSGSSAAPPGRARFAPDAFDVQDPLALDASALPVPDEDAPVAPARGCGRAPEPARAGRKAPTRRIRRR